MDIPILKNALFELKEYGIIIDEVAIDETCRSEDNIKELNNCEIKFVTELDIFRYNISAIDKLFEYLKYDIDQLSSCDHYEDACNGHILISFLANFIDFLMEMNLRTCLKSLPNSLQSLSYLHARVYNNKIYPSYPSKDVGLILYLLKIKIPDRIDI
jgi:hypothetical protein